MFCFCCVPVALFHPLWRWIGLQAYHLRANFKGDLNHVWHRGNLIGNGKLLFCRWENDVNNEGGQDHDGIMKCGI